MRYWLYSCIAVLCASCINSSEFEIQSVLSQPTVQLPFLNGQLKLNDILNDADSAHFKVDADGLVYLSYTDELLSKDVRDLFNIPDLAVNRSFVLPGMTIPPHNKDIRSDSIQSVVAFNLDPEKLSEIALRQGQISYSVSMTPSSGVNYEVHLVLDGYRSTATNKTLNEVLGTSGVIDISNYVLTLNQNKFNLKLVLVFKKSNSTTRIAPATAVNVKLNFESFKFDYIKGFLGQQKATLPAQTINLGIFNNKLFGDADVSFADPRVNITVYNENGVPCTVHFNKLEARKSNENPLSVTLNPANPVSVQYPTQLGDTKTTTISVVNVRELINYAPSEIYYEADVRINEGLTSGSNFVMDTSSMKVKLNVDVPLWGYANGIVLQDTLAVNLDNAQSSTIESATLKLHLTNEFPLDGNLQLVLTDDKYVPITTLLLPDQTNIIKGSTVDAAGELLEPGEYSGDIVLDKEKIGDLFSTKNVIVMVTLQTSRRDGSVTDVKINADYDLTVQAGIAASMKLTLDK